MSFKLEKKMTKYIFISICNRICIITILVYFKIKIQFFLSSYNNKVKFNFCSGLDLTKISMINVILIRII